MRTVVRRSPIVAVASAMRVPMTPETPGTPLTASTSASEKPSVETMWTSMNAVSSK